VRGVRTHVKELEELSNRVAAKLTFDLDLPRDYVGADMFLKPSDMNLAAWVRFCHAVWDDPCS
jgi:hypothetical protein